MPESSAGDQRRRSRASWPGRASNALASVRGRLTLAVTVLFGVALSVAAVALVDTVERNLIDDVQAADEAALDQLAIDLEQGVIPGPVFALDGDGNDVGASPDRTPEAFGLAGSLAGGVVIISGPGADELLAGDAGAFDLGAFINSGELGLEDIFGGFDPFALEFDESGSGGFGPGGLTNERGYYDELPPALAQEVSRFFQGGPDDLEITGLPVSTAAGPVSLAAISPLDEVRNSVETLKDVLVIAIPGLVVVIGLMAWLLTGRALRPVAAITSRVDEISARTLEHRVPEPGTRDEIDHLARTMNAMLDRLDDAAGRQRQFVSDASHELRSPVASIRTELEVALLDETGADWPVVAESVLAEDARLERIVADLLALTRFDEEPRPGALTEVDLDEVVLAEAARPRRVPVDVGAVSASRVQGRAGELSRAVGHLLDNATRHAVGHVRVSVGRANGQVRLIVDDDGPGVAAADRERVFDRFTRLQEARGRDAGGAGLGLAVVRRVSERHGGTVAVADSPDGGARFVVSLPASP